MGKHRHYRVCINGEKDHSSGGASYSSFMSWLENHKDDFITLQDIPVNASKPIKTPSDLVILTFTRQQSKYGRILTNIINPYVDKETGKYKLLVVPTEIHFDLGIKQHREVYRDLGELYTHKKIFSYGISVPKLE